MVRRIDSRKFGVGRVHCAAWRRLPGALQFARIAGTCWAKGAAVGNEIARTAGCMNPADRDFAELPVRLEWTERLPYTASGKKIRKQEYLLPQ